MQTQKITQWFLVVFQELTQKLSHLFSLWKWVFPKFFSKISYFRSDIWRFNTLRRQKILKFVYFCIGATYIATNYRNSTHFLPTGVQRTCESNVHKQKVYRFFCFYQNLISMLIWVCKWPYFALFFWKFRNIMRIITHNA